MNMKLTNEVLHAINEYHAQYGHPPNRLIMNEMSHARLTQEIRSMGNNATYTLHGLAFFENCYIVRIPGYVEGEMFFQLGVQVDAPEMKHVLPNAGFEEVYAKESRETPKTFTRAFTRDELSRLKQLDGVVFEDELLNRTYLGTPDTSEDEE